MEYVSPFIQLRGIILFCIPLLLVATGNLRAQQSKGQAAIDFNKEVEPILADNCYACHGPDPGNRKASLRLDRAEFAMATLKDAKHAVFPNHVELSELIRRVRSDDPDVHMPPAPHGALEPRQVAILEEWIKQGAAYRDHWAFESPVRPPIPVVNRPNWANNSIDAFVLANLENKNLPPSPIASKPELIRRVTLDLTGMLPTPAEVEAFVANVSPDAYNRVVDRLLASPRFGEHRAHYWLDYVRYGDTHGLHNDNYRAIWPYRDYVIRAFNQNKPFDQFAIEQIAGDLLPPTNIDQIVATGFVRCNLSTGEGGAINEEIQVNNIRDRVEAYGTVFLGMTVGCAVCHDHKFDPITQKDFYQLTAFFNNIAERPGNDDRADPQPTVRVPKAEKLDAYNAVLAQKAELQAAINKRLNNADGLIGKWVAEGNRPKAVSTDGQVVRFRFDEGKGEAVVNSSPNAAPDVLHFTGTPPVWGEQTWLWPAVRLEAATKLELPTSGDFEKDQAFSGGGWVQVRANPAGIGDVAAGSIMSRLDSARAARGWDLWYDNGALTLHLVNTWPSNVIKVQTTTKTDRGEWHHFFFTYDGLGKADGVQIFVDGVKQPTKVLNDTLSDAIGTTVPWELGRRYDSDALKLARFQDIRLYSRALAPDEVARLPFEDYAAEIVQLPMERWSEDQHHVVCRYFFADIDEPTRALNPKITELDKELAILSAGGADTMICREKSELAYAHVLSRGIYTARTERVRPDVPSFLPHLPAGEPRDRLALAKWTVSSDNPLTARVTVNRMWQELFGLGIVETPGDFGLMGTRPSNPDLLEWLAIEFRQSGWDMKHMYRLMVTSSAYQQSSHAGNEVIERDPQNRLLARGPRFRMDGEMLRDSALQVSGLLVEKIGGPSVRPYQPPGIWEAVRGLATKPQTWEQDHGEGTYRRSIYSFWKRQAPHSELLGLDAPLRDAACPRRERTDTPLQALILWNDPQWLEAARMLAQRALLEGGDTAEQRLSFISQLVLARPLKPQEQEIFLGSLKIFKQHFMDDPTRATEFLKVGDAKSNPAIAQSDLAAWTLVASQLLNTDEAQNK